MEKEREMSEPTSKFVHVPTNTLTQPHMRTEGCTHLYGCTSTQVHTHSCTHTHLTRVSVQRPLVLKMKRMSERERERERECVCVCVWSGGFSFAGSLGGPCVRVQTWETLHQGQGPSLRGGWASVPTAPSPVPVSAEGLC